MLHIQYLSCALYVFDIFGLSFYKIAGDLLDLVGDGSFETVQDLLLVRTINNLVPVYLILYNN